MVKVGKYVAGINGKIEPIKTRGGDYDRDQGLRYAEGDPQTEGGGQLRVFFKGGEIRNNHSC